MQNLLSLLRDQAATALKRAYPTRDIAPLLPLDISQSTRPEFGHYQCNAAMKLAKAFGESPGEIGERIAEKWRELHEGVIEKIEVVASGFINIALRAAFLSKTLTLLARDARRGTPKPKKRIIVEFSSPNVAKELHVGHLRSTIIGESLARLFEFLGHDVFRLNHIGDWGTQFGMLITYLREKEPDVLEKGRVDLSRLTQGYRKAKELFDADPAFKKRAQLRVVALQRGEPETIRSWERIREISRNSFQEIYDFLDIDLVERGESFYNPYLHEVVEDFEKRGLIAISNGAKCVFLEGFRSKDGKPLPLILQKSDGGYNYSTTDLAALRQRIDEERADQILYVVDGGQRLHFQMVFKAAQEVGYLDPKKTEVKHVPFGVVIGPDGKKFKTRSGKTEKLLDLLREAVDRAREILKQRIGQVDSGELGKLAHILGIDALKYADLSSHRMKDYTFSYDRMLNFEGNTATYLLYSYVRILGIGRKLEKEGEATLRTTPISLRHPAEIELGLHLCQFEEALENMEKDLLPNRLSDYLYSLAEKFHAFFRDCRVEGSEWEEARFALCALTARILQQGLHILGLKTMDRM